MDSGGDELEQRRLRTWIDWYRFARRELEYEHGEAVVYANVRTVEDLNREHRSDQAA